MVFRKAGYTLLHSGHVIANHILVSFHAAFISSLLNIGTKKIYDYYKKHLFFVNGENKCRRIFVKATIKKEYFPYWSEVSGIKINTLSDLFTALETAVGDTPKSFAISLWLNFSPALMHNKEKISCSSIVNLSLPVSILV